MVKVSELLCADLPAAARDRATSLTVQSRPDGARVFLDGRQVGRTPLTLPVSPGRHRLQASLGGHQPATPKEVEVTAGDNAVVQLQLVERANLNPWDHGVFWQGLAITMIGGACL